MKFTIKKMSLTDEEKKRIFNGIWYTIHKYAAKADEEKTGRMKSAYREYIKMLSEDSLPCADCSKHMREYLQSNPLESASSYFEWSYNFHNSVNRRLGKSEEDYGTAKNLYFGEDSVCTKCGSEEMEDTGDRGTVMNPTNNSQGIYLYISPESLHSSFL